MNPAFKRDSARLLSAIFNDGQGKRLFSPIAAGGTLGAIAGAALTEALMRGFPLGAWQVQAQPATLFLLSPGCLEAVDKPAREMLYIPLGPEEKYKSKPFIDTFIYRGGDAIGVWLPALTSLLAVPMGVLGIAAGTGWIWTGARLAVRRAGMGGGQDSKPVGDEDGRLEGQLIRGRE